jgi:hypothetical protein
MATSKGTLGQYDYVGAFRQVGDQITVSGIVTELDPPYVYEGEITLRQINPDYYAVQQVTGSTEKQALITEG